MKREERFLMSHRPYAVDLSSLHKRFRAREGGGYWDCRVVATWFRRRSGVTMSCIGYLWDYQDVEPTTTEQFLQAYEDGRYGGTTTGRWDGEGYWGEQAPSAMQDDLDLLQPMLDAFPAVPDGFDGWWTFHG